jgi:WD40 repeat protein
VCLGLVLACSGGPTRTAAEFSGPHTATIVDVDRVGPLVATVGEDRVAHVWTWPALEGVRSIHTKDFGTAVALSPDGRRLAVADRSSRVSLWDTTTWTRLERLDHPATSLAWSGPRLVLALPDQPEVAVYNTEGETTLFVDLLRGHRGPVVDVAFSADGAAVATASTDRTARVWNILSGEEEQMFVGHRAGVVAVAFSPDGTRVATGSQDKTARVWDRATGEPLRQLSGHRDWVVAVAFPERDGVLATADASGRHRLWGTADGAALSRAENERTYQDATFVDGGLMLVGDDLYVENVDEALDSELAEPRQPRDLDNRCRRLVGCGKSLIRSGADEQADRGMEIVRMAREMDIGDPTICLSTLVGLLASLPQPPPAECQP